MMTPQTRKKRKALDPAETIVTTDNVHIPRPKETTARITWKEQKIESLHRR